MLEKLFVIISDNGIYGIYTNLNIAKTTLKEIYDKISEDNKSDDNTFEDIKSWRINVYHLDENEYKSTMTYYTYKYNAFWINDDWMTTEPGYKFNL